MQMQMKRGFSASSVLFYKDVQHKEEGKKIVVQGVTVASPNKSNVVTEGCREGRQHCHPFCRSPVVGQVKHTDVLLIDQFLTSTGEMYSQDELGICKAVGQVEEAGGDGSKSRPHARQRILCG